MAAADRDAGRPGPAYQRRHANAPRWLLSGHARCGICGDGSTMHASGMGGYGPERGSAYRCDKGSHCATPAIPADQAMTKVMIARLSQPDIAGLLPAPEPRPDADVTALRAETRKLHAKRDDLARLLTEDVLTEAGVRQERKRIDARLAEISTELADATQIDLLPELRAPGADPARMRRLRRAHVGAEMLAMAAPDDSRLSRLASRTVAADPRYGARYPPYLVGNLVAKVATRCRAEPGDLCAGTRLA